MTRDLPSMTVIGGYLGAGKTTLLNHLLRNSDGSRIAVLVNDFGDVNIDADLIVSTGAETIALANGCVCCSLADGLATALGALRGCAGAFDHVVVEASGVSDPVRIGQYGEAFGFRPGGVVVVVDAEQVRASAGDRYVGETVLRQLESADLLVVNKVDLVTSAELNSLRLWLDARSPGAKTLVTRDAAVAVAVVLGPPRAAFGVGDASLGGGHAAFQSWCLDTSAPVSRTWVEEFTAALPDGVLRVKGFVRLVGDTDRRHLLQGVGRRFSLHPHDGDVRLAPDRLVLIGVPGSFDVQAIPVAVGWRHATDRGIRTKHIGLGPGER